MYLHAQLDGVANKTATPFFSRVAAGLHTAALFTSLFVETTTSVFAGAWLMFHLMGCAVLIYNNRYDGRKSWLWLASLAWLCAVPVSTFLIVPVFNGAYWMWVLTAMPMLFISLNKDDLRPYIKCFGAVLVLYAITLSLQKLLHVHLGSFNFDDRPAWPLADPNNAAAMMNLAFTPCLFMTLFKDLRWSVPAMLFAFAIYATGSRTGLAAGALSAALLYTCRYGMSTLLFIIAQSYIIIGACFFYRPEAIADAWASLCTRFTMWWAAVAIWHAHPFKGSGLGVFGRYYVQYGPTIYIPPAFVHNDILQFAVEMGTPVAAIFVLIVAATAASTWRGNIVTACTALAILLQASMEFQFYLPSVTLGMGLVLAWHNLNSRPFNKRTL